MEVSIPSSYHPKIIGRKGQVIQKIRTDHGVQIQFPPVDATDSESDKIILTGYEHNCEAGKEAILKIVRELVTILVLSLFCPSAIKTNLPIKGDSLSTFLYCMYACNTSKMSAKQRVALSWSGLHQIALVPLCFNDQKNMVRLVKIALAQKCIAWVGRSFSMQQYIFMRAFIHFSLDHPLLEEGTLVQRCTIIITSVLCLRRRTKLVWKCLLILVFTVA